MYQRQRLNQSNGTRSNRPRRKQKKAKKQALTHHKIRTEWDLCVAIEDLDLRFTRLQFNIDFPNDDDMTLQEREEEAELLEQKFKDAMSSLEELLPRGISNHANLIKSLIELISAVVPQKKDRIVGLLTHSQIVRGGEGIKLLAYIATGRYDHGAINHLASRITNLEVAISLLGSLLTMCTEVPPPPKDNIMRALLKHRIFQDALEAKFRAEVSFKGMSRKPHWVRALVDCLPHPERVFVCQQIDSYIEDIYPALEHIKTFGMGSYCFLHLDHNLKDGVDHANIFMLTKHEGGIVTLIFRDSLGISPTLIDIVTDAVKKIMGQIDIRIIAEVADPTQPRKESIKRQYCEGGGCVQFASHAIDQFQTVCSNFPSDCLRTILREPHTRIELKNLPDTIALLGPLGYAPLYCDTQSLEAFRIARFFAYVSQNKLALEHVTIQTSDGPQKKWQNKTIERFFARMIQKFERIVLLGYVNFFADARPFSPSRYQSRLTDKKRQRGQTPNLTPPSPALEESFPTNPDHEAPPLKRQRMTAPSSSGQADRTSAVPTPHPPNFSFRQEHHLPPQDDSSLLLPEGIPGLNPGCFRIEPGMYSLCSTNSLSNSGRPIIPPPPPSMFAPNSPGLFPPASLQPPARQGPPSTQGLSSFLESDSDLLELDLDAEDSPFTLTDDGKLDLSSFFK